MTRSGPGHNCTAAACTLAAGCIVQFLFYPVPTSQKGAKGKQQVPGVPSGASCSYVCIAQQDAGLHRLYMTKEGSEPSGFVFRGSVFQFPRLS
jgi:hypothetical protein